MIRGGPFASLILLTLDDGLFFFQRRLGFLDVGVQRLGFTHQFQNSILALADFLLRVFDLVLEGAILFIGFGAHHLITQFADLLLLHLNIAF